MDMDCDGYFIDMAAMDDFQHVGTYKISRSTCK